MGSILRPKADQMGVWARSPQKKGPWRGPRAGPTGRSHGPAPKGSHPHGPKGCPLWAQGPLLDLIGPYWPYWGLFGTYWGLLAPSFHELLSLPWSLPSCCDWLHLPVLHPSCRLRLFWDTCIPKPEGVSGIVTQSNSKGYPTLFNSTYYSPRFAQSARPLFWVTICITLVPC